MPGFDLGGLFGGGGGQGLNDLMNLANRPFSSSDVQKFLPKPLRKRFIDPILRSGIAGLGDLIRNPGGLSPGVAAAIAPRLAAESQTIATNFRGIGQEQAGAAARNNLPVSIKAALDAALNVSQERAQRSARQEALSDSEALRREDLQSTFDILDALLGFTSAGRGQSLQALSSAAQAEGAGSGANMQFFGSILSGLASNPAFWKLIAGAAGGVGAGAAAGAAGAGVGSVALTSGSRFKEDIAAIEPDDILDAIKALPVYEWSYKGEGTRHIGPLAEDFLSAFGVGDSPDKIHVVDAVGTLMAATKALAKKVERLERVN